MGHEIVPISSKTSANFLTAFHASMTPFKTREMGSLENWPLLGWGVLGWRGSICYLFCSFILPNIKKLVMLVLLDGEEVIWGGASWEVLLLVWPGAFGSLGRLQTSSRPCRFVLDIIATYPIYPSSPFFLITLPGGVNKFARCQQDDLPLLLDLACIGSILQLTFN